MNKFLIFFSVDDLVDVEEEFSFPQKLDLSDEPPISIPSEDINDGSNETTVNTNQNTNSTSVFTYIKDIVRHNETLTIMPSSSITNITSTFVTSNHTSATIIFDYVEKELQQNNTIMDVPTNTTLSPNDVTTFTKNVSQYNIISESINQTMKVYMHQIIYSESSNDTLSRADDINYDGIIENTTANIYDEKDIILSQNDTIVDNDEIILTNNATLAIPHDTIPIQNYLHSFNNMSAIIMNISTISSSQTFKPTDQNESNPTMRPSISTSNATTSLQALDGSPVESNNDINGKMHTIIPSINHKEVKDAYNTQNINSYTKLGISSSIENKNSQQSFIPKLSSIDYSLAVGITLLALSLIATLMLMFSFRKRNEKKRQIQNTSIIIDISDQESSILQTNSTSLCSKTSYSTLTKYNNIMLNNNIGDELVVVEDGSILAVNQNGADVVLPVIDMEEENVKKSCENEFDGFNVVNDGFGDLVIVQEASF